MENRLVSCAVCGQTYVLNDLPAGYKASCRRCGATIASCALGAMHMTAAYSLAALLLYLPANIFPILEMNMYGITTETTIWQGCVKFWQGGDAWIAVVVFLASILVPFLKLLGLFFLVTCSWFGVRRWKKTRSRIFRIIEKVGRWAMLDVFVLAVLVSLVKLQRLATILPGKGVAAFAAVVVFTLLASASFDPHLIWDEPFCGENQKKAG